MRVRIFCSGNLYFTMHMLQQDRSSRSQLSRVTEAELPVAGGRDCEAMCAGSHQEDVEVCLVEIILVVRLVLLL